MHPEVTLLDLVATATKHRLVRLRFNLIIAGIVMASLAAT